MRKMMMIVGVAIIVAAVIGGVVYVYEQLRYTNASPEIEIDGFIVRKAGEAFYKQYNNLEELEQAAELIIIGEPATNLKSLKQSQIKHGERDLLGEFWVNTPVKVLQVIKGEYEDNEIIIPQHIYIDVENNYVFAPSGYSPLAENAQYVLFLKKHPFGAADEGQEYAWNIISYNHGKYNLDGRDHIEDLLSDDNQQKLKKKVIPKYQSLSKNN